MIELRDLHRFVTLVDLRSFTSAALELGMSQPALSQAIARLERELGGRLVDRDRRPTSAGIHPTPAGEALYLDAVDLLSAARRTEARARRRAASPTGANLVVGFSPGVPRRLISAAMAAGDDERHVAVIQLRWAHEHEALDDGTVDVLLHQYPQGYRLPGCTFTGVAHPDRVALFAADHPLASRTSVALGDLAGEPVLDPGFHDGPPGFRELWLGLPRPAGAAAGPVVGPANSTVEEMFAFVAAHRGMAITSAVVPDEYGRSDVVSRVISDLAPLEVGVVVRTDDARPEVQAVVATLLAATAAGHGGA